MMTDEMYTACIWMVNVLIKKYGYEAGDAAYMMLNMLSDFCEEEWNNMSEAAQWVWLEQYANKRSAD